MIGKSSFIFSLFCFFIIRNFCSNYARVLRHTGPFVQEYTPRLRLVAIYQQLGINIQTLFAIFLLCDVDKLLLIIKLSTKKAIFE